MVKYFKFFIPALTVVLAMYICTIGSYYSTLFFVSFTLFVILGDIFLSKDVTLKKYTYPGVLKLSLYICLPILFIFISIFVGNIGNSQYSFTISITELFLILLCSVREDVDGVKIILLLFCPSIFVIY